MPNRNTGYISGSTPQPMPQGSEVISIKAELAALDLAVNSMLAMCWLPEDCVPVDAVIVADDLDTGAGLAVDFGLFDAAETAISIAAADGGDEWIDGSTELQAAVVRKMTTAPIWRTVASKARRKVGFLVTVAAAGNPAAGNKLSLVFSYRYAHHGQ